MQSLAMSALLIQYARAISELFFGYLSGVKRFLDPMNSDDTLLQCSSTKLLALENDRILVVTGL